jgi:hypothetical protein
VKLTHKVSETLMSGVEADAGFDMLKKMSATERKRRKAYKMQKSRKYQKEIRLKSGSAADKATLVSKDDYSSIEERRQRRADQI